MTLDIGAVHRRASLEGKVFQLDPRTLAVFDPRQLSTFDRLNFADLHMAPRWTDAVRGRPDRCPVLWSEVRQKLIARTRRLDDAAVLTALYDNMCRLGQEIGGKSVDLTIWSERVICEPLVDHVFAGLRPADRRVLLDEQRAKIANVLYPEEQLLHGITRLFPRLKRASDAIKEIRAGRVVARNLKRRLSGKSPPQDDYAEAVLELAGRLGISRMTYVMTTLLTAIAGAPGTLAACILFELLRHPAWKQRIADELEALPLATLAADPARNAPLTDRFLKEAMRLWTFPLLVTRPIYREFAVDDREMRFGEAYCASAYVLHRDPDHWPDPERFDPDRWTRDGQGRGSGFSAFGWGARTCVGASFGLAQYFLFMRLVTVGATISPATDAAGGIGSMGLDGIAAPMDFHGDVTVLDRPD
ncbi:MAG: cytochrome P450 [Sphingomonas sp.]|jgi:hypothetical protein|uniref:cytochrome P450 n=1 Tax=Sphingomonas sp. TaxID=28214 RepID=UPI00356A83BB